MPSYNFYCVYCGMLFDSNKINKRTHSDECRARLSLQIAKAPGSNLHCLVCSDLYVPNGSRDYCCSPTCKAAVVILINPNAKIAADDLPEGERPDLEAAKEMAEQIRSRIPRKSLLKRILRGRTRDEDGAS